MRLPIPNAIAARLEERSNQHVGLLAEFPDPGALYDAVKGLRERGYTRLDTFSPFPIHGMDRAMGLPVSKIGYLVFFGGITGAFLGWLLQWWTSEVDYPINISNKPLYAFEASVPIIFELTILFSALTAVGAMLALNGLPRPYDPLFYSDRFGRATDDGFFLHVAAADGTFAQDRTTDDLLGLGATAVEYVDHDGATLVGGADLAAPAPNADRAPVPVTPPHTTGDL
ncbi:DUF3341 domain-containing protein [Rubrivirga sp. S365]|uniref:DUF3341 domain-containing protein n=1 Tax=Rubrivirga litoralis TaxID=3075598 RepID=A0ABU3BQ66_9BACT|nr:MULTISPECIES: DUF3341 domain-containing protein [unclassified Rubrivirga]MDT0631341.1 DUF3341 domain-containing protein [Rubrivirga sp. F394]MDT7855932.1 DUF3341 domain-containing protein [Rubrivirga sp. S365]